MIPYTKKNPRTVNFLKALQFDKPAWTPCMVEFLPATWIKHRERLSGVIQRHPKVFPDGPDRHGDFDAVGSPLYEEGDHLDSWGCLWRNVCRGMDSLVVHGPLEDWGALEKWRSPDPLTQDMFGPRRPWEEVRARLEDSKAKGDLAIGNGLPHGAMFMRLGYLRGYENLMIDLASGDTRLDRLIRSVCDHNTAVIRRYVELGVEVLGFAEDLGHQSGLAISPTLWRRVIGPCYSAMFAPCRDHNVPVWLHSDGHILDIIPDLIESGVRLLNLQLRPNGLEGVRRVARGKVALLADLDRQSFPFLSPREIDSHVQEVFHALHLTDGGLMLHAECGPDVPIENIEALCHALEVVCQLPDPDKMPGGR